MCIFWICFITIKKMFCIKHEFFFALTKCFVLSLILSKFSFQLFLRQHRHENPKTYQLRQTAFVLLFNNADKPGSFSALRPVLFVIPNDVKLNFYILIFLKKFCISWIGSGHPFNIINTQVHQS